MFDLPTTMSKFLDLGMPLDDVVAAVRRRREDRPGRIGGVVARILQQVALRSQAEILELKANPDRAAEAPACMYRCAIGARDTKPGVVEVG